MLHVRGARARCRRSMGNACTMQPWPDFTDGHLEQARLLNVTAIVVAIAAVAGAAPATAAAAAARAPAPPPNLALARVLIDGGSKDAAIAAIVSVHCHTSCSPCSARIAGMLWLCTRAHASTCSAHGLGRWQRPRRTRDSITPMPALQALTRSIACVLQCWSVCVTQDTARCQCGRRRGTLRRPQRLRERCCANACTRRPTHGYVVSMLRQLQ